jgi:hypothetical protein
MKVRMGDSSIYIPQKREQLEQNPTPFPRVICVVEIENHV